MPTSELRKALTVAGGGSNLVHEDIEASVRADLQVKSPLVAFLPVVPATGTTHTVVKRTARGGGAWAEGEMTAPSYSNTTPARRNVTVKILRTAGAVSGFQQAASRTFTDSLAGEIEGASDDFRELLEFMAMYGTADENVGFTGDAYQFNGIYPWILKDAPTTTLFDKRGAKIALSDLDDAMDVTVNKYQNLKGGKWFWMMSSNMNSTVSGLQALIQRQVTRIQFEGGFEMESYRGIPIIQSGFVAPNSLTASVAGLGATAAGSGSVAAGTYRYRIAAITLYGEQVASDAASVSQSGGDKQTNLSWTANAEAKLYAIYRTTKDAADSLTNFQLLDIIAAKAYDSTGAVTANVATYTDDFTLTRKANAKPLGLYNSSSMAQESIFLVYLDQMNGASLAVLPPTIGDTYGGDPTKNLIRYSEIPVATSSYAFRLESFQTLQIPDAKVCAAIRGAQRSATS